MKCSIIIVNYKVPHLLRNCLLSIRETVSVSHEVIVTDNDSQDGSVEMMREEFPEVHVLAERENHGFAKGNNLAWELAKGEYIFFLNPDTIVKPGAVDTLVAFLDAHSETGMAAPLLRYPDGSVQRSVRNDYSYFGSLLDNRMFSRALQKLGRLSYSWPGCFPHDRPTKADWVKGAAMMMRNSLLKKIGAFDEQFWIYAEEMDLCLRIRNEGFTIDFRPEAEVIHFEKQSTRQVNVKMRIQNYKSFFLLLKKHYPAISLWAYRNRVNLLLTLESGVLVLKKIVTGSPEANERYESTRAVLAWLRKDGNQI